MDSGEIERNDFMRRRNVRRFLCLCLSAAAVFFAGCAQRTGTSSPAYSAPDALSSDAAEPQSSEEPAALSGRQRTLLELLMDCAATGGNRGGWYEGRPDHHVELNYPAAPGEEEYHTAAPAEIIGRFPALFVTAPLTAAARESGRRDGVVETAVSRDRGKTWEKFSFCPKEGSAAYPMEIGFFTESDGWMLLTISNPSSEESGEMETALYLTADGARTWEAASLPAQVRPVGSVSFSADAGGYCTAYDEAAHALLAWRTTDRGAHWSEIRVTLPETLLYDGRRLDPPFFQDRTGVLPAVLTFEDHNAETVWFYTLDGGENWTYYGPQRFPYIVPSSVPLETALAVFTAVRAQADALPGGEDAVLQITDTRLEGGELCYVVEARGEADQAEASGVFACSVDLERVRRLSGGNV